MGTVTPKDVRLEEVQKKAASVGLRIPEILLPAASVDLKKFAVIACDQYTSEPEYWEAVEGLVGDSVSSLHLIYPEIYLEEKDKAQRIIRIQNKMREYLKRGEIVSQSSPGVILVRRTMASGLVRTGFVIWIDLDSYEYKPNSDALCRATEKTIESRIPPRLEIRKDASIELPHVLVLIDDPTHSVISASLVSESKFPKVYDFDLMMDSGHLEGRFVADPEILANLIDSIAKLHKPGKMLFAVGDGNHSLATAKTHWENLKREKGISDHPARYALVEIQNLHDPALHFEPIHRILWDCDAEALVQGLARGGVVEWQEAAYRGVARSTDQEAIGVHLVDKHGNHKRGVIRFPEAKKALALATLTDFIDAFLKEHKEAKIDYVHGMNVVEKIKEGVAFILPNIHKDDLFRIVEADGVLPRKTFSMGSADEKRFYLEAKSIV